MFDFLFHTKSRKAAADELKNLLAIIGEFSEALTDDIFAPGIKDGKEARFVRYLDCAKFEYQKALNAVVFEEWSNVVFFVKQAYYFLREARVCFQAASEVGIHFRFEIKECNQQSLLFD